MHSHVDYRWHKTFLNRVIKILICFCLVYTPFFANANDSWSWKHHNKMREQERLKAHLVKQINESGSKKVVEAVVETRPTAAKVGGVMFKRLMSSAGGKMLGVYAVIQLIEGIGWVMEDGTYVKKIKKDDYLDCTTNTECEWEWRWNGKNYPTAKAASVALVSYENKSQTLLRYESQSLTPTVISATKMSALFKIKVSRISNSNDSWVNEHTFYGELNPDYKKPEDIKTVPLTPALLGAAMLGTGYKDPDPDFDNSIVNNDDWTAVPEAYTPDESGVGNELANELEKKADAAPRTSDGKPAPLVDPKYNNDLSSNDSANDRSWENRDEDGTKGSTESNTSTDPETGETTQTGSFKLPAFCDWASAVCDWFDWTKENPDTPEDNEIPQITELDIGQLDTGTFKATPGCPQPIQVPVNLVGSGSISISYEPICAFASKWAFVAPLIAFLSGAMIIVGVGRKGEDS